VKLVGFYAARTPRGYDSICPFALSSLDGCPVRCVLFVVPSSPPPTCTMLAFSGKRSWGGWTKLFFSDRHLPRGPLEDQWREPGSASRILPQGSSQCGCNMVRATPGLLETRPLKKVAAGVILQPRRQACACAVPWKTPEKKKQTPTVCWNEGPRAQGLFSTNDKRQTSPKGQTAAESRSGWPRGIEILSTASRMNRVNFYYVALSQRHDCSGAALTLMYTRPEKRVLRRKSTEIGLWYRTQSSAYSRSQMCHAQFSLRGFQPQPWIAPPAFPRAHGPRHSTAQRKVGGGRWWRLHASARR